MAAQTPASEPWQPVTDYTDAGRRAIEGRNPELILDWLARDGDDVLDYGCGPASHLVRLLQERERHNPICESVRVYGYDPQIDGSERELERRYGLVVCREVLEHLTLKELVATVRRICALSTRTVYVTTRFAKAPSHLLSVDTSDDLDPTHITMGTKAFLRLLFVLEGFRRRPDLEDVMDWQKKGRVLVYERA